MYICSEEGCVWMLGWWYYLVGNGCLDFITYIFVIVGRVRGDPCRRFMYILVLLQELHRLCIS